MSELTSLINRLQKGVRQKSSYINSIRNPQLLISSLKELNTVIGNEKIKDSIAAQVSHLIMTKLRAQRKPEMKEDDVMLNCTLCGPPGTGKTLIGTKIAKILYSLGYIDGSKNVTEKSTGGVFSGSETGMASSESSIMIIYIFLMLLIIGITVGKILYGLVGTMWTLAILGMIVLTIIIIVFITYNNSRSKANISETSNENGIKNTNTTNEFGNSPIITDIPSDDQIIKVVSRADFVDKYVGWSDKKTLKLLNENLGKVLFIDEAYSLINGPDDQFGNEVLTVLNLFLSQHPNEIIVIFAGYKDLMENTIFAMQPGLKSRCMWHFECNGYTAEEIYEIFKLKANKGGWSLANEAATKEIFVKNSDAFKSYGRDAERLIFYSKLEHSKEYIKFPDDIQVDKLYPVHIERGIQTLRDNSVGYNDENSTNPMANMMKLLRNSKQPDSKPHHKSEADDELDSNIPNILEIMRRHTGANGAHNYAYA